MLLFFPQGSPGVIAKGPSDTLSIHLDEGSLSDDVGLDTLDNLRIHLGEVASSLKSLGRSDFLGVRLGESAGVSTGTTTAKAVSDTLSVSLSEVSTVAVTLDVTDTLSVSVGDVSSLDIATGAVATSDDIFVSLDDAAVSSFVADVERDSGDTLAIHLEDQARPHVFQPVTSIRFEVIVDQIRFIVLPP